MWVHRLDFTEVRVEGSNESIPGIFGVCSSGQQFPPQLGDRGLGVDTHNEGGGLWLLGERRAHLAFMRSDRSHFTHLFQPLLTVGLRLIASCLLFLSISCSWIVIRLFALLNCSLLSSCVLLLLMSWSLHCTEVYRVVRQYYIPENLKYIPFERFGIKNDL